MGLIQKTCKQCGEVFDCYETIKKVRCKKCSKLSRFKRPRNPTKMLQRECQTCGLTFYVRAAHKSTTNCEYHRLAVKGRKKAEMTCRLCGKRFIDFESHTPKCIECRREEMEHKFNMYVDFINTGKVKDDEYLDEPIRMCKDTYYRPITNPIVDISDLVDADSATYTFTLEELNDCLDELRRTTK